MSVATHSPVAPLFSFAFLLNPEPTLAWLRENDPLHALAGTDLIVLTRYEDCAAVFIEPAFTAAGGQARRVEASGAPVSMLNTDGPQHHSLRRPGAALLGPPALRRVLPGLAAAAGAVVAPLHSGSDLTRDVSEPYATRVLTTVLGIPPDQVASFDRHARAVAVALDPMPRPASARAGQDAVAALHAFADELMDAALAGSPLAQLAASGLDRPDALGIITLATVGGWSPLAELTTVAVHRVLGDSELRARIVREKGFAARWCEDAIRWHTPIPFVSRRADRDVALPSGIVPAGTQVLVHIGSADRDPSGFDAPGEIRADRDHPRDHLAFGAGPHYCLGAGLVRAALPVLLTTLLSAHPQIALRAKPLVWQASAFPRRPISTVLDLA